jgi:hypothetical protein
MQRFHMVAFDKAPAPISVSLPEVKAPGFARERTTARLDAADLLLAQRGLSLPYSVQAQKVSAFHNALVLVADELRSIPWFVLLCSLTQTLCKTMHLLIIVEKSAENSLIQLVSSLLPLLGGPT